MKFQITKDEVSGETTFSGSFSDYDIIRLDLGRLDTMLMQQECSSAADFLLTLEMLYRRHAEQQAPKEPTP